MAEQRTILVVDDDDSIREIAQVSLELIGGWNVLTAHSGTDALQRVATEQAAA